MTLITKLIFSTALLLGACSTNTKTISPDTCLNAKPYKACESLILSDFNRFIEPDFLSGNSTDNKAPSFNGFVVSIDKSSHANYGAGQVVSMPKKDHEEIKPNKAKCEPTNFAIKGANGESISFLDINSSANCRMKRRINRTFTGQQKAMFVTGVKAFNGGSNFEYNITTGCKDKPFNQDQTYIDCSFLALNQLEAAITTELDFANNNSNPYTHVIIHSTGWHNRQDDSIKHYNTLFKSLEESAKPHPFNPLYIGLTWPADWDIKIISYINKANDADEVGFIWANYLLNKTIPSAINHAQQFDKPKFIAMGHSFGARVIATAANSKPYIISESSLKTLDTLILIQPAMSVVRLHNDPDGYSRKMGHFNYYNGIENLVDNIIITSSARDTTNGFAIWSGGGTGHAGTVRAYQATCDNVVNNNPTWTQRIICRQQKADATNDWSALLDQPQPILYLRLDTKPADQSQENYDPKQDAIKDHNDFKDTKFTDILFPLIK